MQASASVTASGDSKAAIGEALKQALSGNRLQSISLHDERGDVLWLDEGALGPDEHNLVVEAAAALNAGPDKTYVFQIIGDGRAAAFLPARSPLNDLLGLAMIIADAKFLDSKGAAKFVTPTTTNLMRRLAFLRKPTAAGPPPAAAPPPANRVVSPPPKAPPPRPRRRPGAGCRRPPWRASRTRTSRPRRPRSDRPPRRPRVQRAARASGSSRQTRRAAAQGRATCGAPRCAAPRQRPSPRSLQSRAAASEQLDVRFDRFRDLRHRSEVAAERCRAPARRAGTEASRPARGPDRSPAQARI